MPLISDRHHSKKTELFSKKDALQTMLKCSAHSLKTSKLNKKQLEIDSRLI